jgi:hypothetical protein
MKGEMPSRGFAMKHLCGPNRVYAPLLSDSLIYEFCLFSKTWRKLQVQGYVPWGSCKLLVSEYETVAARVHLRCADVAVLRAHARPVRPAADAAPKASRTLKGRGVVATRWSGSHPWTLSRPSPRPLRETPPVKYGSALPRPQPAGGSARQVLSRNCRAVLCARPLLN